MFQRITTGADRRATDPIVKAIVDYENGAECFEQVQAGSEDSNIAMWEAPLQSLKSWSLPIQSRRGAIVALKLLLTDCFLDDDRTARALLPAVVAFLERQPLQPVDIDQKLFFLWRELERPLADLAAICTAVRALADRLGPDSSETTDALNFMMDHASERTGFVSDLRDDLQALFLDRVQPSSTLEAVA